MDPCSVGVQLQATNECHKTYYTRHTGFKTKEDISSFDLLLLQLRTGMTLSENDTICFHHAKIYIERFEDLQKSCCDPFNMHRKLSKKNLRAIDLHDATFLTAKFGRQFVPGWKLCPKCMQVINGSVDVEAEERQRRKLDSDVCIWISCPTPSKFCRLMDLGSIQVLYKRTKFFSRNTERCRFLLHGSLLYLNLYLEEHSMKWVHTHVPLFYFKNPLP